MTEAFQTALEYVLFFEGKYINHPQDKGGPTKYGITQRMAREKGYAGNMRYLRKGFAKNIYYDEFWMRVRGDELWKIDKQLAIMIFDWSVTSGVDDACKAVQLFANAFLNNPNMLHVDGNLGVKSRAALGLMFMGRSKGTIKKVNQGFIVRRTLFYNKNSQYVFVNGHCRRAQGFNFLRELKLHNVYNELRK